MAAQIRRLGLPQGVAGGLLLASHMPQLANETGSTVRTDGDTLELPLEIRLPCKSARHTSLASELAAFSEFGQSTRTLGTTFSSPDGQVHVVPTYVNEFWTAEHRQASSLHEISYRACFKPQFC